MKREDLPLVTPERFRKCTPQQGALNKALGVKSGVPDLVLPVARGMFPLNFCPRCGSPLTDEAVDMVMERLEALKDAVLRFEQI